MRFRLGLAVGFAAGYTLGARAGRERYDQIVSAFQTLKRSEPAQQLGAEVRDAASRASHLIEEKAAEGVSKVTDRVRGNGTTASMPGAAPPPGMVP
jgi:hypothetical protein